MPNSFNSGSRYTLPDNLRQQVGLGRIGPTARDRGVVRSGLGIESIERAFFWNSTTGTGNYTGLSATSWTALDTSLFQWDVTTSGKRPVEFKLSAWIGSEAAQLMGVSLLWDGVHVTNEPYGMAIVYDNTVVSKATGFAVLDDPGPGTHTLTVAYRVSGGTTGVVQVHADVALFVSAKEV